MAGMKTGTFEATGSTSAVLGKKVAVSLVHAGTATVNVQWRLNGVDWVTHTAFTATGNFTYDGVATDWRLNCSAYTNDVVYTILAD